MREKRMCSIINGCNSGSLRTIQAAIFFTLLLLSGPTEICRAQTTIDAPCDADGFVWESGPGGNGTGTELEIGRCPYSPQVGDHYAALRFDLTGIPSNAVILKAEVHCYYRDAWGTGFHDRHVALYGAGGSWTESTLTWNQPPLSQLYSGTDIDGSSFGWYTWEVTDLAREWILGTASNFGVVLAHDFGTGEPDHRLRFCAREHPESDKRPFLRILCVTDLPNLRPNRPGGWSDRIVVSPVPGTTVSGYIYRGEAAYIDWAFINDGSRAAGAHMNILKVDGVLLWEFPTGSVPAGTGSSYEDGIHVFPDSRTWSLHVEMDTDENVVESNEDDNVYEIALEVENPGQAPATYLDYLIGAGEAGDLIVTEARVARDAHSTYYCALCWTGISSPNGGYTGMQSTVGGDLFIFSLWDAPDQTESNLEWRDHDVSAVRFGTEGQGWSTKRYYDWDVGADYIFFVRAYNRNNRTFFSQYVYDKENSLLKHQSVISYPYPDFWFAAVATFLEDFAPINGQDDRHFDLQNGWKRKAGTSDWFAWNEARFNYSLALPPNENDHYAADAAGRTIRLMSGGQVPKNGTPRYTTFSRDMPADPPLPPGKLASLAVTGPDQVPVGGIPSFECRATWENGSETDVTGLVSWFSSVDNLFVGNSINLQGVPEGAQIVVTAQHDLFSVEIQGSKTITVGGFPFSVGKDQKARKASRR